MSPYDENWNLDMDVVDALAVDALAVELQLNHPATFSIVLPGNAMAAERCGGCGSALLRETVDDRGRAVRDFACGHRYVIGQRTVSIERV